MSQQPNAEAAAAWDTRWVPEVCEAIVILENVPCFPDCGTWDGDDCDCEPGERVAAALRQLWPMVRAEPTHGIIHDETHPLRLARLGRYEPASTNSGASDG